MSGRSNYHKTWRGSASLDANDGEKDGRNIGTDLDINISPFWRSEAAEAKPTFPFNFLRLPPAPPAVFLKGKEMLVLMRPRYERARGAESPRNPSVRFSPEFPRAPRVRNGFEQSLVFLHKMILLALIAQRNRAPQARRKAENAVASRRNGWATARKSGRICFLFRIQK